MESQASSPPRPVIYQLLPRLFGNTVETRQVNGPIEVNGCGKFSDISEAALISLREMGFTHLWLTGVLEQASGTSWPGRPADTPDVLKGIAGSPYAIKDYFDVCPDYAEDPEKRLAEFQALVDRCHAQYLKVIIDFVPNHVARSYHSDVKPELSFGSGDNTDVFFQRDNHFYYLRRSDPGGGAPLKLPTAETAGCSGLFEAEAEFGRVTGNNSVSWSPSIHDWYETVKLNYGHDFTSGRDTTHLPASDSSPEDVPRTWRTMDAILAYWQHHGVDGFRVDMAHMIPMEFWRWVIRRARARNSSVFFSAEAYDNDPAKLSEEHVMDVLLGTGFDAVYDDPIYDVLEGIYDSGKWANDIDTLTFTGSRFHHSLRYAENHDEVRLASPKEWGGWGMRVGRPVSAVLFGMGRGPIMLYSGQEVGEPAAGEEGFGGDDARTTIFDYWSMPEFTKWVNGGRYDGGRLSEEQMDLREWYGRLLRLMHEPAFERGDFYGLNHANKENPGYGRVGDETASGHWLYAYLRRDAESGQAFLVIANFSGSESLSGVRLQIPWNALEWLQAGPCLVCMNRLDPGWSQEVEAASLPTDGLPLPTLEPLSAMLIEIRAPEAIA
ncbi:alpha-amylase family glycosyl hydrolase [Luteolibacter sp. GHJ8]|uniref:Alpha-amylase family glycosyl hydrolase n=1 Tax=Luteolibacter rhizosphaerae TaxID=2989719 RepID=A0ABT3G307_9BACT|nr:alpha-amylase family glycosyl hydrolase [Luteolibacter rhizosphaerae]MCW1914232.1 alpha-amylase family glycosyl hydrolase [Luteolibacter rhizosphaerae]